MPQIEWAAMLRITAKFSPDNQEQQGFRRLLMYTQRVECYTSQVLPEYRSLYPSGWLKGSLDAGDTCLWVDVPINREYEVATLKVHKKELPTWSFQWWQEFRNHDVAGFVKRLLGEKSVKKS